MTTKKFERYHFRLSKFEKLDIQEKSIYTSFLLRKKGIVWKRCFTKNQYLKIRPSRILFGQAKVPKKKHLYFILIKGKKHFLEKVVLVKISI